MKAQSQLLPPYKPTQQQAVIIIQSHYRGYISRKYTKKSAKKFYQRKKIIEELIVTQEKYIYDLGIIISDFQMYLINSNIITKDDAYTVFCNVDAIRKLNQHFFTILYNDFQEYWNYKIMFQVIKKQTYFFKIYFEYLNNFTNSMAKVKTLKQKNKGFVEFINKIKKNSVKYGNLDLEDYLIKPVQRLPKYVLLFKQLIKKTCPLHPDYENINKVLQNFQEVNCSNNQKLNKMVNSFKLSELERQAQIPFHITEPGTEFVLEEHVTILNSSSKVQDAIMYLLNNRIILTKKLKNQQKYFESVSLKYGTSIMENEDQQNYANCFTVQSIDGDSITFLCQTEEQKFSILDKIQLQIIQVEKKTYEKYSVLRDHNQINQSLLKKISRYDLNPEVLVLGTQQRNDKMLKYTTYIIEVKIKNIRKKIFLRYSQLLHIQTMIDIEFPKMEIKQSLFKTTWILNHKPKTIEERKMSIQKFLKQILNKPEILERGGRILCKLGLPQDFYSLPLKFKDSQSFIKRDSVLDLRTTKSERQESTARQTKSRRTYRFSIFQDLSDQQEKPINRKFSYNQNLPSSTNKKKLTIQQLLCANQIYLGHFIRYSQNIDYIQKKQIEVQVYLPWLENSKGIIKKSISILESQRVAHLIMKLAHEINLPYYKDFRLFLERQYSQRILDNDQIILKIENQILTGKYKLVFKKYIYLDIESEQNQIKNDRLRLKLIASQIIHDVKKSKYKLQYKQYLLLSVLIGIIQHQTKIEKDEQKNEEENIRGTFKCNKQQCQPKYSDLALKTRQLLTNSYASFFENDAIWIKDFICMYKKIYDKLKKIAIQNSKYLNHSKYYNEQEMIRTSLIQLCYRSIIDEIKQNKLFGSMGYVVQIDEEFRQQILEKIDKQPNKYKQIDEQTLENRNLWLIIKCNQIFLYSINLEHEFYQIKYEQIHRIICYPSSIILSRGRISTIFQSQNISTLSNSAGSHLFGDSSLKFKTTASFSIRQLINYYKNYNQMSKKIEIDQIDPSSILQMIGQNEKLSQSEISIEYVQEQ